jgi:hypothetical protein
MQAHGDGDRWDRRYWAWGVTSLCDGDIPDLDWVCACSWEGLWGWWGRSLGLPSEGLPGRWR